MALELSPREQVRPPSNILATLATSAGSPTHAVSSAHPSRAEPAPSRYGLGQGPPLLSSIIHGLHPVTTLPCTALLTPATAIFAPARLGLTPHTASSRTPLPPWHPARGPNLSHSSLDSDRRSVSSLSFNGLPPAKSLLVHRPLSLCAQKLS